MVFSEKGVTVVELLAVLSIVGILAILGLANLAIQIPHFNLADAGRQIASDLRLIRHKAITEGAPVKAQFYPGSQTYHLSDLGDRALPYRIRFGVQNGVPPLPDAVSPSDGVSFSNNAVTFQPNGTIIGIGGAIYLTNNPSRNESLAISVIATGRVRIYRWDGNVWK